MPLTLEDFLSREPTLGALRRELDVARAAVDGNRGRRELRRLATEERDLVELLTNRWTRGLEGWMTSDEGAQVAAELMMEADRRRRVAWVAVRGDHLVFTGGAYGEQLLALGGTSPVRARKHWTGYLDVCPSTAALVEGSADPADRKTEPRQLSWLDKLGDLLGGPKRPRPEKRGRFLSIPLGRPKRQA